MGQKIGNIGVLNLINATEESLKDIEHINNVGFLLYSSKTAALLTKVNIGNIGKSISLDGEYQLVNGSFTLDAAFLEMEKEEKIVLVNGIMIISNDVTSELLNTAKTSFYANGIIYAPAHLKGSVQALMKTISGSMVTYEGQEPILKNGTLTVDNGFLQSLSGEENLAINGVLTLDEQLDLNLFSEKINRLDINGVVTLYEQQLEAFSNKGIINGVQEVIPAGHIKIKSLLSLDSRSIRRFKGQAIFTKKPIIINKDVTRDAFTNAFKSIHSTSYITCHEDIEDLVYESLAKFDTDVYTFTNELRFVSKETWSRDDLMLLGDDTILIIDDKLTINESPIIEDFSKISSIILKGDIHVPDRQTKAMIQKLVNVSKGTIIVDSEINHGPELKNIGELTL